MMEQLTQLTQAFERIAIPQPQWQRVHPPPERGIHDNLEEEDEAEENDEMVGQHRPKRQQRDLGNNIKMKIPSFKGTSSPDEYLEWVRRVEKIFEYYDYTEARKCKLAVLEFTDYANLWWENLKAQRRRDGEEEIRSWRVMKNIMKKRFVPEYYKQELYIQLQSLRQGGMCVEDYIKEFEMLMMKCELQEPQEQTIARFLGGLHTEIANTVELQPYVFLEDVIKLAIKVERQMRRGSIKPGAFRQVGSKITNSNSTTFGAVSNWNSKRMEKGNSYKQLAGANKGKEKMDEPTPPKRFRDIKCFRCLGHGHIASECPNKKVMVLRESQGIVESEDEAPMVEEEDEIVDEKNIEYADEGDLLVIRRVLNLQAKKGDEQRENIFHTRCTIDKKVCGVIIDGGSCTNVASTTLVEKLNLTIMKHPHPYRLKWLNEDGEVKVTKQVLVSFSIGRSYKDEVLCDVVPMSASHLLLGRPWQYDRRTVHDGFENTYSFVKDGKSIVLAPLSSDQVQQDQLLIEKGKKESLFVRKGEIEQALFIRNLVLILMVKEVKPIEKTSFPSQVEMILEEFSDVFPQELPKGLPPIRGIEH